MSSRPRAAKDRRDCFEKHKRFDMLNRIYMECYLCGLPIYPAREGWEAEHPSPHANGGTEILPVHAACHKPKTAEDISKIAKGKRVSNRHFGIAPKGRSFATNRNGRWKKKLNGEVVER